MSNNKLFISPIADDLDAAFDGIITEKKHSSKAIKLTDEFSNLITLDELDIELIPDFNISDNLIYSRTTQTKIPTLFTEKEPKATSEPRADLRHSVETVITKSANLLARAMLVAVGARIQLTRVLDINVFEGGVAGEKLLDIAGRWFPKRISDEEIGDAIERIRKARNNRESSFCINRIVAVSFFWITMHSLIYAARNLYRRGLSAK